MYAPTAPQAATPSAATNRNRHSWYAIAGVIVAALIGVALALAVQSQNFDEQAYGDCIDDALASGTSLSSC